MQRLFKHWICLLQGPLKAVTPPWKGQHFSFSLKLVPTFPMYCCFPSVHKDTCSWALVQLSIATKNSLRHVRHPFLPWNFIKAFKEGDVIFYHILQLKDVWIPQGKSKVLSIAEGWVLMPGTDLLFHSAIRYILPTSVRMPQISTETSTAV